MSAELKERLVRQALAEGFSRRGCDAAGCGAGGGGAIGRRLLRPGYHGQMGWMAERMGWRGDPAALWPEARSVVMLAEAYTPEHDPLDVLKQRGSRGGLGLCAGAGLS